MRLPGEKRRRLKQIVLISALLQVGIGGSVPAYAVKHLLSGAMHHKSSERSNSNGDSTSSNNSNSSDSEGSGGSQKVADQTNSNNKASENSSEANTGYVHLP